jgi:tetratricopeptide (TPR) repeat protein
MWANRVLEEITASAGPVVFAAPYCYGSYYVLAALPQAIWLDLNKDERDPIVQGNKLADAVARTLGGYLVGYGLPYRYALNVLRHHLKLLGPMTLVLSGAEHAVELARELLTLHSEGSKVVLACERLPQGLKLPCDARMLTEQTLALSVAEAQQLSELLPAELETLLTETQGAYERVLIALYQRQKLPAPLRPTPEGPKALIGPALSAEALLTVLIKQGRYLEALELASRALPHETPKVLESAGEYFWERGLAGQLDGLLGTLPEAMAREPRVLEARLRGALAVGKEAELIAEVAPLLETGEYPELRALYAEARFLAGDLEGCLSEAKRAARAEATPQTLLVYGLALATRDVSKGLVVLERGLQLAEQRGSSGLACRLATALAVQQARLGRYQAAVHWAEYGERLFVRSGAAHHGARLTLLNAWARARLLSGRPEGVLERLRLVQPELMAVRPELAAFIQATLADALLANGEVVAALEVYDRLWDAAPDRVARAMVAPGMVRVLLEAGQPNEALARAESVGVIAHGLSAPVRAQAELAWGMALSACEPGRAVALLEAALRGLQHYYQADGVARAAIYLIKCSLLLNKAAVLERALALAAPALSELGVSGWRYLAGADGDAVRQRVSQAPAVRLCFLGDMAIERGGQRLAVRLRFAEMLAALALNPQGLTSEQLTLAVFGEAGDARHCRMELSRLRRLIPITSRPYRIALSYQADFIELAQYLAQGDVAHAMACYRGPLLAASEAPVIVEQRAWLEASLQRVVLASGEVAALWELAERLGDALELWARLLELLPATDPRYQLAQARLAACVG